MHVTWHFKGSTMVCEMSENTFKTIMNNLNDTKSDFIQINDARFDNSMAKFVRKNEILGFDVPELPLLKYLGGKE